MSCVTTLVSSDDARQVPLSQPKQALEPLLLAAHDLVLPGLLGFVERFVRALDELFAGLIDVQVREAAAQRETDLFFLAEEFVLVGTRRDVLEEFHQPFFDLRRRRAASRRCSSR